MVYMPLTYGYVDEVYGAAPVRGTRPSAPSPSSEEAQPVARPTRTTNLTPDLDIIKLRDDVLRLHQLSGAQAVLQLLPLQMRSHAMPQTPPVASRGVQPPPAPVFTFEDVVCIMVLTFALATLLDLLRV